MTKPKSKKAASGARTQAQLDREDEAIKEKLRQQEVHKTIDPVLAFIEKNEKFAQMPPERIAFVLMCLQPKDERPTFAQMAERLKVSDTTLFNWQNNDLVRELRAALMPIILQRYTPDVVHNLARRATSRDPDFNPVPAIKLWLQYVEQWKETQKLESDQPIIFGFPPSQFVQPVDGQKPHESHAQKNTKAVKEVLGKKRRKE